MSAISSWVESQVEELKRLVAAHMKYSEIGALLGCTRNAAIGKARRLGLDNTVAKPPGYVSQRQVRRTRRQAREDRKHNIREAKKEAKLAMPRFVIPAPVSVDPLNLTIDELQPCNCRYITNDDVKNARYCGHETFRGSSWCLFHLHRVIGRVESNAA